MKRVWNTPEVKELNWDKTMSGESFKSGETSESICKTLEDGIGIDGIGEGDVVPSIIVEPASKEMKERIEYFCLSS